MQTRKDKTLEFWLLAEIFAFANSIVALRVEEEQTSKSRANVDHSTYIRVSTYERTCSKVRRMKEPASKGRKDERKRKGKKGAKRKEKEEKRRAWRRRWRGGDEACSVLKSPVRQKTQIDQNESYAEQKSKRARW